MGPFSLTFTIVKKSSFYDRPSMERDRTVIGDLKPSLCTDFINKDEIDDHVILEHPSSSPSSSRPSDSISQIIDSVIALPFVSQEKDLTKKTDRINLIDVEQFIERSSQTLDLESSVAFTNELMKISVENVDSESSEKVQPAQLTSEHLSKLNLSEECIKSMATYKPIQDLSNKGQIDPSVEPTNKGGQIYRIHNLDLASAAKEHPKSTKLSKPTRKSPYVKRLYSSLDKQSSSMMLRSPKYRRLMERSLLDQHLTDIPGVGRSTIKRLNDKGILTPNDFLKIYQDIERGGGCAKTFAAYLQKEFRFQERFALESAAAIRDNFCKFLIKDIS
ncbi:hypothetical protein ACOME3_003991 [Neoechinorhynchus agilis]